MDGKVSESSLNFDRRGLPVKSVFAAVALGALVSSCALAGGIDVVTLFDR